MRAWIGFVSCVKTHGHLSDGHSSAAHLTPLSHAADTRKLQPSAPSLVGMGRRQLQQDSLLPPNSTSNSSFAGASPPAPDSTVAGVPSAALPQSPFSAAPEAETSGFPPLSADFPEDLELGAPTESPLEVQTVADAPLASAPNGSIPAEPVTHVVLSPAGVASHEDGTAVLDTPPAVDGPVNGTADFPTPPAMYDNSNGTVGGGIPPAFNGSEVPAVPPSPETLIDTVFSNQIHEGHLRISVVVIIASLMMICGLGAFTLFISARILLACLSCRRVHKISHCPCEWKVSPTFG